MSATPLNGGGYDFEAIKAANPIVPFLAGRGVQLQRLPAYLIGKCPIHQEKKGQSFTVWPDEGRFWCFGKCGFGGDVIDLRSSLDGISLSEAAQRFVEAAPSLVITPVATITKPVDSEVLPYKLNRSDRERMAAAAHRLAGDPCLIEKLCERRPEWTPEAVRGVALEGDLGYEDGSILFGYTHGIKRRRKDRDGSRKFDWICGAAHGELWRQSLMVPSHRTVYIVEGETDALTLVSLGIEVPGETLVLALAGATIYPKPGPFTGREIVLVLDPDEAGSRAGAALEKRLQAGAKSVTMVPLKEVCRG